MIRTQIYLTAEERKKIAALAYELGTSKSELIRNAIDEYIIKKTNLNSDRLAKLQAAKGIWSARNDLPDFISLRREFDERSTYV